MSTARGGNAAMAIFSEPLATFACFRLLYLLLDGTEKRLAIITHHFDADGVAKQHKRRSRHTVSDDLLATSLNNAGKPLLQLFIRHPACTDHAAGAGRTG